MLVALFVPVLASQHWPVVFKGVLEGFGLTRDLDDLQHCLADIETGGEEDMREAVDLFSKKDAPDVLKGLGKIGAALEKLPAAVSHCDAVEKDVKNQAPKLRRALAALKNPTEFAY